MRTVPSLAFALLTTLFAGLVVASPASGATVDVFTYNNQFSTNPPGQPIRQAVISVGDSVRWVWLQGSHTTTAVAGSPEQWNVPLNSTSTEFTRVFLNEGVYWFYCIPHGVDNGDGTASGMSGTITVLPAAPGACCLPSGECEFLLPADCIAMGGTFQGAGTTCDPDPCAVDPIEAVVVASKDNVLYETVDGSLSNATGTRLFVGNQASGAKRRSVLSFDLATIPPGSMVLHAELQLFCNQSSGAAFAVTVQRLTSAWGEGTSVAGGNQGAGGPATPGDATWLHTFFPDQFWATPGGDFAAPVSASTSVSAQNVHYQWTSTALIEDVQHWVNMPGMNRGWILRGDEATADNPKRFDSREATTEANRPRLTVIYLPPGATGACCFGDGSCAELTADDCAMMSGTYQGDGTMCHMVSCPIELTPFVDPLPRPGVAQPVVGQPGGAAHYDIAMTEQFQQLHRDLPPTRVWGYDGSYPGPTIEARRGEPVTVVWRNDLRVVETGELRTTHTLVVDECLHGPDMTGQVPVCVVHLHGGKVAPESDGNPDDSFPPGGHSDLYTYPNDQPSATLWYHDHALGITRLNVMMGMAGFYIIRDDAEDALGLPSGDYEIAMAIQDRSFHADGSIKYHEQWHEHFFGETIVVNGKVWPFLEVDRGKYRFRMVNGSNSRAYTLALSDGAPFWQIGSDLGLLEMPVPMTEVTFLPGERVDLVMDFAGYEPGTEIILTNSAPAPFPGFPGVGVVPDVMKFVVGEAIGHTDPLSDTLVAVPRIPEEEAAVERVLDLRLMPNDHCPDHHDQMWTIDGLMWDDITEFPVLGTTEIWTWRNDSGIAHPMHLHLVMAQVLDRQAIDPVTGEPTGPRFPPAPNEMGWKDTINAPPGYFTRTIARFEGFTGLYPYHCHILEHEDHEMMRQFMVVEPKPECIGDLDRSGVVDGADLGVLLQNWGPCPACVADLDGNGTVDGADLGMLLQNWGACR